MKVLVCGGRTFGVPPVDATQKEIDKAAGERLYLRTELANFRKINGITELCHGGATGADSLAGEWAVAHSIPIRVFYADWDKYSRAAGPIRNKLMLDKFKPHIVLAFPGGRGTAHMKKISRERGVQVIEFKGPN